MSMRAAALLVASLAALCAADAPAPAPVAPAAPAHAAAAPAAAKPQAEASPKAKPADDKANKLTDEERWVFDPTPGRTDPFYDLRKQMELDLQKPVDGEASTDVIVLRDPAKTGIWAKAQLQKVESLMVAKKWDEVMKTCESAIKTLSKDAESEEARQLIEKFKRYATQAEEAKTFEEAQAKFDALDLKIEGILWSPEGSLAVITGEPRARAVNERVKDCVIINIDTNRVDFLFHYKRRRFEFQRYVGEDAKASAKKDDAR